MTLPAQLVVLAKEPLPGRAKTRLSPPLTPAQCADVARACLLDTLAAVAATPVAARTVVLDGSPAGWLPAGPDVLPQRSGDLGARLDGAFADTWAARPLPLLLVGMDTPQATPALLTSAVEALLSPGTDAVLGLAADGGWWALGLRRPVPGAFDGVPMSTDRAGAVQRERLAALGLRTSDLPELRDVDTVEDLTAVAAAVPRGSHLARVVGGLGLVAA